LKEGEEYEEEEEYYEEEEEVEDAGPLQLNMTPVLDPKSFQTMWVQFPERY
jgi:hypothetical protein